MSEPAAMPPAPQTEPQPLTSRIRKFLVSNIIGILIIGSFGSGIWETVEKPALIWIRNAALDLFSLGIASVRTQAYKEIASRHDHSAALILTLLMTVFLMLAINFQLKLLRAVYPSKKTASPVPMSRYKNLFWMNLLTLSANGFMIIKITVVTIYAQSAVTHLDQMYSITAPYMKEEERLMTQSEYSQIQSREDFQKLIERMYGVAKTNSLRTPKPFEAW